MKMDEIDVQEFFISAIKHCGKLAGVENYDILNSVEVLQKMKLKNEKLHHRLMKFLEAYRKWFRSTVDLDSAEIIGQDVEFFRAEVAKNIEARDSTRNDLLEIVRSIA